MELLRLELANLLIRKGRLRCLGHLEINDDTDLDQTMYSYGDRMS